jgi:hypothetical protein
VYVIALVLSLVSVRVCAGSEPGDLIDGRQLEVEVHIDPSVDKILPKDVQFNEARSFGCPEKETGD